MGLGFVYLALAFFHHRKWLLLVIAVLVAVNIHTSTIVIFAMILGIFYFSKKPINLWLSIPLYLFFAFVFDVSKMSFISDLLSKYVTLDSSFQSYIDNSDLWFGEDAIREQYNQSTFALIMTSLFYISLFYLGYLALKARENKHVLYLYNSVVLGVIMLRAVFNIELLRRFANPLEMFYFIPLGYVFYIYYNDCKQPKNHDAILLKKYFPVGITFILVYLFMFWGRFIFLNPNADFFWYHF